MSEILTKDPAQKINIDNGAFINGQLFEFIPGESILDFVRRNLPDENVPTLCDAPNLKPFGSCRGVQCRCSPRRRWSPESGCILSYTGDS